MVNPPDGGLMGGDIETLRTLLLEALQSLGTLQQQAATLQAQSQHLIKQVADADLSRKGMYERLSQVERETGEIANTVRRIAPMVENHEQQYQRGIGVVWLMRAAWIAVSAGVGAIAGRYLGH